MPSISTSQRPPVEEADSTESVADAMKRRARDLVAGHPEIAVATAVALGVVIGWFVKRK